MPDTAAPPEFLTVAQVAETLGVSAKTVYRLGDSGALPYVLVGAQRRIPRTALDEYAARARDDAAERRTAAS